jgi:glycosyltransferase involved in cell wall biosynthesis
MIILFCIPQFNRNNIPLQPWLTFYRVSLELVRIGYKIHIITDVPSDFEFSGLNIHKTNSLRGTNSSQIKGLIESIKPKCVILPVTPFSLLCTNWYKILKNYRSFASIFYPFYSPTEIIKSLPHITLRDYWEYGRNLFAPERIWYRNLIDCFNGVICQTKKNTHIIRRKTFSKIPVHMIPPGIDKEFWSIDPNKTITEKLNFLYLGSAKKIRGYQLLLDALSKIVRDSSIKLKILARGGNERFIENIRSELKRRNLSENVTIKGGWIQKDQIKKEIESSIAVVLPFVLVPSEIPVTVMECISCGTPVIVSNVDGLPEAVGKAGIIVPQGNTHQLAIAIKRIHLNHQLTSALKNECVKIKDHMLSWQAVAKMWQVVIEN